MQIRCRKCFKKFEDYEPECPRCGALNEKRYKRKDNVEKESKKARFFDSTCNFCGHKKTVFLSACRGCGNEISEHKEIRDENEFIQSVNHIFKKDGLINCNSLKDSNVNLEDWVPASNYKYGVPVDKSVTLFIGGFIIFIIIMMLGHSSVLNFLLIAIFLGLPAMAGVYYFSVNHKSEYLEFSYDVDKKLFINWMKKNDMERDIHSRYAAYIEELSYIEIKQSESLDSIRFIGKEEAKLKSKDIVIDLEYYEDDQGFKGYLIMLAYKFKVPINIITTRAEESLDCENEQPYRMYIRLEKTIKKADETLLNHRSIYFKSLAKNYELLHGETKSGALMTIKSNDYEKLLEDLNRDPFVENGIIEVSVEEWII